MAIQMYCGGKPTSSTMRYGLYEEVSTDQFELHDDTGTFCPSGTIFSTPGLLQEAYTTTYTIDVSEELDVWDTDVDPRALSGLLYCAGEFMSYESATLSGTQLTLIGIHRGLFDTVPKAHLVGNRVWGVSEAAQLNARFSPTGSVTVLAQPEASGGTLSIDSCSQRSITFASRATKPYPPGNVKLAGTSYSETFTGDAVLTWVARNRLLNTSGSWYQTDGDTGGAEANTTYTLTFYDSVSSGLLRTEAGLTGLTYTYTEVDQLADNGGVDLPVGYKIKLQCFRDGVESLQYHEWVSIRS
jgi:hypothetical protein